MIFIMRFNTVKRYKQFLSCQNGDICNKLCRDFSTNNSTTSLINSHEKNNIITNIVDKMCRKLHLIKNHPLNIIKTKIENYFLMQLNLKFDVFDDS